MRMQGWDRGLDNTFLQNLLLHVDLMFSWSELVNVLQFVTEKGEVIKNHSTTNKQEHKDTKSTHKLDKKESKQREIVEAKEKNNHHNEQKESEDALIDQVFPYRLVSISHWTLPCQISSLAVFDVTAMRHLLASYPGGTYTILTSFELNQQRMPNEQVRGPSDVK